MEIEGKPKLLEVARTETADEEDSEEKKLYELLTEKEPALSEVLDGLPKTEGGHEIILKMSQEGDLILGSDGSADHAEKATCAVTILSKYLTTVHASAYRERRTNRFRQVRDVQFIGPAVLHYWNVGML